MQKFQSKIKNFICKNSLTSLPQNQSKTKGPNTPQSFIATSLEKQECEQCIKTDQKNIQMRKKKQIPDQAQTECETIQADKKSPIQQS